MATYPREMQEKLRNLIAQAVAQGVIIPVEVEGYLLANGWKYDLPTRMTTIKLLKENHVVYVWGGWVKQ